MDTKISHIARSLVVIPFFATAFPLPFGAEIFQDSETGTIAEFRRIEEQKAQEERADKIDAYMNKRDMPLEGYGRKMVEEATRNGIDWRLLPAIAVRESSGGKNVGGCTNNPFGWGSCRIEFKHTNEAIEVLARNLGGNNPNTSRYYGTNDNRKKLYYYNGTVIPTYPSEVLAIMRHIEREEL